MKTYIITLAVLFLSISSLLGQQNDITFKKKKVLNKGKFFVYWRWNWASFSKSDIRFKGDNYDFTLQSVKAHDTPSAFTFKKYFGIQLKNCYKFHLSTHQ